MYLKTKLFPAIATAALVTILASTGSQPQWLAQAQSLNPPGQGSTGMTAAQLEEILRKNGLNPQQINGQLRFAVDGVPMLLLSDERANRMRLVSQVAAADTLDPEEYQKMMIANFHLTLDARYAVSNGVVFAAFVHPLSTLDERDFLSALRQVSQLVKNFGTSYSSGALFFGPGEGRQAPEGDNLQI